MPTPIATNEVEHVLYKINLQSYGSFVNLLVTPNYKNGYIDILNDFEWTTGGYVDEVPYILVKEMQLNYGQVIQNLYAYIQQSQGLVDTAIAAFYGQTPNLAANIDPNDPYASVYSATDTGFNYVFPHLIKNTETIKGQTVNTWKRNNLGSAVGNTIKGLPKVGSTLKPIEKFLGNEIIGSGIGIEDIVTYSSTAARKLKISFPLYNTESEATAIKNSDFVNLFGLQNLKTRTSFLTFIPPKIYTIESPGQGGIYMPAAFVSSFDVMSIGTTRFMNSGQYSAGTGTLNNSTNGLLIPEAYKVDITFEEIIPQSSNIMFGSLGGNKISVVNNVVKTSLTPAAPNEVKAVNASVGINNNVGAGARIS
jgi:hypothetical protein